MFNPKLVPLLAMLGTALIAACTSPVGPQKSLIKTPSLWSRLTGATPAADLRAPLAASPEAEVDHHWWKQFDDPTLDVLIAEALANNKTLQMAKARVEEARASRRATRALLLPQIIGAMGTQRSNLGYFTGDKAISFAEAEMGASWEIDLFGRNQARTAAATAIHSCKQCGFFATEDLCEICLQPSRGGRELCVVEQATDILPLEKTGSFRGLYHALGGRLAPLDHIGPDQLRIEPLLQRLHTGKPTEIILALSADVEGEATTNYLVEILAPAGIPLTRIAHGLPAGGGLEHSDQITLQRALSGRRPVAER